MRVVSHKSGPVLILTGVERAAEILGCESLGPRPMSLPADLLLGAGWRAQVWAAYLGSLGGEGKVTISRAKLRELSGVPERTQARLEHAAGVVLKTNYCVTDRPADRVTFERDFMRPHGFRWRDAASGDQVMAWRLPSTRITPSYLQRCARGRTRKINRSLRGVSFYEVRDRFRIVRIFHKSLQAAERAARRICRPDQPRPPVSELFYPRFRARRATVWTELRI